MRNQADRAKMHDYGERERLFLLRSGSNGAGKPAMRGVAGMSRESAVASVDSDDPDRELVERAQAELPYGTAAYNEIVRKYSSRVYGRSYGILRSSADAEEAVQDVFLSVFRNLPRFRFERPFQNWLSTVTLNACRMTLRKRASEQRRRQAAEEQAPPPERPVPPDIAMRRLVLDLLDTLDPGTRVPLLLRYVEGYSYPELAKELDLTESAVKMRVARGTKKLKELYAERTAADAQAEASMRGRGATEREGATSTGDSRERGKAS